MVITISASLKNNASLIPSSVVLIFTNLEFSSMYASKLFERGELSLFKTATLHFSVSKEVESVEFPTLLKIIVININIAI